MLVEEYTVTVYSFIRVGKCNEIVTYVKTKTQQNFITFRTVTKIQEDYMLI